MTKQEVINKAEHLLQDIGRSYRKNEPLTATFAAEKDIPYVNKTIAACWIVCLTVDDEQFFHKDGGSILMFLDDATGEIEAYLDGSAGRPVPMRPQTEQGKYKLVPIPL